MQDDTPDLDVQRQLEAWSERHSRTDISPELARKVRETLTDSLTPVKPVASRRRYFLLFLAVFIVGSAGLVGFVNRVGFQLMTPIQMSGISVILLGGGILFAQKLAEQMIPGSGCGVPLWEVLTLSFVAVFGGLATLFPWQNSGYFVSEGWPCALMEITTVIPAMAVFWLLARRGALFASAKLGATLTGLAAFLVLIPVQFRCMFQEAPHLLVWHGVTALLMVGLGTFGGMLCRGRLSAEIRNRHGWP